MFGFRHSLNFFNGARQKSNKDKDDIGSMVSITGAYRTNRDEFIGYNYPDAQRKSTTNANSHMPTTSTGQPTRPLQQAKSTSDLINNKNLPPTLRSENPGVSQDPRGAELESNNKPQDIPIRPERKLDAQIRVDKQRLEEQKKLEKRRLEEQKKQEKKQQAEQKQREKEQLAEQKQREKEQLKQEKLRKEREKKEAQMAKKKKQAPQRPVANPLAQSRGELGNASNPIASGSGQMAHSTNTLDSSISKTSGPPPYSDSSAARPEGEQDSSGNVTYTKPVDTGSWDMVSKHRENINRPATAAHEPQTKQTVMDLNYKVGEDNKENSEA